MPFVKRNRYLIAAAAYWLLLAYILAALIFWFFELQSQNQRMFNYRRQELRANDPAYAIQLSAIDKEQRLKTTQYIGEGSIFLVVILIGALFLYRAVLRQIRIQQQQQQFMMAITHELKTPIATTRLNLETLIRHKLDEEKQKKLIRSALEETSRLNTITNNILVSAQLEGGRYPMAHDELDLSLLVLSAIMDFKNKFPDRKWTLAVDPELAVRGDSILLQILVNNLLENALKYAPKEEEISVALHRKGIHTQLVISDRGPGIPDKEKKKVFDKFYRVGNEETRIAQGTGLGLYLCKKIAGDHQAAISISDNLPVGTIFTVSFKSEQS